MTSSWTVQVVEKCLCECVCSSAHLQAAGVIQLIVRFRFARDPITLSDWLTLGHVTWILHSDWLIVQVT